MATVLHKEAIQGQVEEIWAGLPVLGEKVSEVLWAMLCLLLFLLLGPFSAPVVLMVLFKQASENQELREPESIESN